MWSASARRPGELGDLGAARVSPCPCLGLRWGTPGGHGPVQGRRLRASGRCETITDQKDEHLAALSEDVLGQPDLEQDGSSEHFVCSAKTWQQNW